MNTVPGFSKCKWVLNILNPLYKMRFKHIAKIEQSMNKRNWWLYWTRCYQLWFNSVWIKSDMKIYVLSTYSLNKNIIKHITNCMISNSSPIPTNIKNWSVLKRTLNSIFHLNYYTILNKRMLFWLIINMKRVMYFHWVFAS